jgi:demethylphylloquinol methyltransferase
MQYASFDDYSYDRVAWFYDELAAVYSLGRIRRSKERQLDSIRKGDRVLYAGVGCGTDALLAARFGARVTAIDLSPRMLARFARRLAREGLDAELIEGDAAAHVPATPYDVVVANYFLNLFEVERAEAMLQRLGACVRRGGSLMITDFARPLGGPLAGWITGAYYAPANAIAAAFGFCARHPIPDYEKLLAGMGFHMHREERLPVLLGENPAYVAIVAERSGRAVGG